MKMKRNLFNAKVIARLWDAFNKHLERIKMGEDLHVSISNGNRKMGPVPSVSLLPVIFCPARCKETCAGDCYALRDANTYPNVRNAYANNSAILQKAPTRYWREVNKAIAGARFFRFHVSGDIPNYEYFCNMVDSAIANEHCEILAFTKHYEVVNKYIDTFGDLPENLHIMFSGWFGLKPDNPHNLPETNVLFEGMELPDNWLMCGGNCSECGCAGVGCWQAQKGQTIAFKEH